MKHLLFLFTLFLFSFSALSQESKKIKRDTSSIELRSFNEETLEKYRNSESFNYQTIVEEPSFLERIGNWIKKMILKALRWMFDDISPAVGVLRFLLEIVPWIILGVLLVLIARFFLKMNKQNILENTPNTVGVEFESDATLLQHQDLKALISKAVQEKDYRVAIRYYYLFVLQTLTQTEKIFWKQEKTNEDYIRELEGSNIIDDFRASTRLYDFTWYGNFDLDAQEFDKAQIVFESIIGKING